MSYIKVDHSRLEKAADELEKRISAHDTYMKQANDKVRILNSSFSGTDYNAYEAQWRTVTEEGSTSKNIIKTTQAYADFLRYAASQYKKAQSDAVNRANKIPF